MALTWPSKDPSEVEFYGIDWTQRLAGDGIATSVFSLADAQGVTIVSQSNTPTGSTVQLSGGTDGQTAQILCTITTVAARTLEETIFLPIVSSADTPEVPATATKRQVVEMAFEEIGLAGYEFDATPQEQASALRRLDGLMAEWKGGQSLDLGYLFPASFGGSDLDEPSGLPDASINTVAIYLALRVMPAIGKSMTAETRLAMASGMQALRTYKAVIPTVPLPIATVRGAGAQKRWLRRLPFTGQDVPPS